MENIVIEFNMNAKLLLNKYMAEYLGGFDPKLQWQTRGIAGHKIATEEEKEFVEKAKQAALEFIKTQEGLGKLREFSGECIEVYKRLLCDQNWVNTYLEGKKIIFVAGAVRSGGTHLTSKLFDSFDLDITNYNLSIAHDDFPNYTYLYSWNEINMFQLLLFEIAQFLVWAKREFKGSDIIIKKRTAFIHALPFLYSIFGDSAEYVVTVRHPVPCGFSIARKQGMKIDDCVGLPLWRQMALVRNRATEEEFDGMNCMERFLLYWQICYEDVVRCVSPNQNISIVTYDEKSNEDILGKIAKKYNGKILSPDFKVIEREYNDIVPKEKVEGAIERVRRMWELNNLTFPDLEIK